MRSWQPWAGHETVPEPWDAVQEQAREGWQRLSLRLQQLVRAMRSMASGPSALLPFPAASLTPIALPQQLCGFPVEPEISHSMAQSKQLLALWWEIRTAHLCFTSAASPHLLNAPVFLTPLFLRCLLGLTSAWALSVSKLWTAEANSMQLPGIKSSP